MRRSGRRGERATCGIISTTISETRNGLDWSCSTGTPQSSVSRLREPSGFMVDSVIEKVRAGQRIDAAEALELYRFAPTAVLGQVADAIRRRKHPDDLVTYIIDRNVNYTNVCVAKCNFCAFYRDVGSPEGYVLGFEEIFRKIDETIAVGGNQFLLQGGHNPDLPIEWYEDLFRAIKRSEERRVGKECRYRWPPYA